MQKLNLYAAPGHLLHVGISDGLAAQLLLHICRQQALHSGKQQTLD
jgi:hypothetical protein